MRFNIFLAFLLSLFTIALALPSKRDSTPAVGENDIAVVIIGISAAADFNEAATLLQNAIVSTATPTSSAVVAAVASMRNQLTTATAALAALKPEAVGAFSQVIAIEYVALLNTYLEVIYLANAISGFLHTYGAIFDSEMNTFVVQLDTAAHGSIAAIAADGQTVQNYISSLGTYFATINITIFSNGAV